METTARSRWETAAVTSALGVAVGSVVATFLAQMVVEALNPYASFNLEQFTSASFPSLFVDGTLLGAVLSGLWVWQCRRWSPSFATVLVVLLGINVAARLVLGLVYNALAGVPILANLVGAWAAASLAAVLLVDALILRWPTGRRPVAGSRSVRQ